MSSPPEVDPQAIPAPAGVIGTPSGPMPYLATAETKDYPRLVFSAPRFETIAIADIIQPSVTEAVQAVLPSLVPPYVTAAANDAVNALAVRRVGDTMTGGLNLSPTIPTAPTMAATKQYVDTMVATSVPEVPPVPIGASWLRQTGQWTQAGTGGTVTSIATTGGITGGPITTSGTLQLANMAGNTLKGNNTGSTAAPTDLTIAQTMTMLGAAPLNSPAFSGTPQLPTGTAAVTQPGGTNNTSVATTAFVTAATAAQLVSPAFTGNPTAPTPAPGDNDTSIATTAFVATSFAPLASPVFTGTPSLPTGTVGVTQTAGDNDTSIATTQFVTTAVANGIAAYLPLTGGVLASPGNLTVRGGILGGAAGTMPAAGAMLLNANTVAPPAATGVAAPSEWIVGANNTNPNVYLDGFGTTATNGAPIIELRRARGTAAAPTAVQNGDYLAVLQMQAANGAGTYGANANFAINILATENWTGSANGTSCQLLTTVNGTTSAIGSLILAGNQASFSGSIAFGLSSGTGGLLQATAINNIYTIPGNTGQHQWNNTSGNLGTLDSSGNLVIQGSVGQKVSGTTWANPSARDLKENIQPYSQGLQAILALNPCTWDFAADSGIDARGPHIGLVHDETAHMPEMHRTLTLGGGDDAREVDGLDCSAVTWALVNAVKTLNERLTVVEGRAP